MYWHQLIELPVAYMYLGQAIRTCLSAGFNREPVDGKKSKGKLSQRGGNIHSTLQVDG
jgi:hypothetical protein